MITLDHLAVACTDLEDGTAWVEDQLGVRLQGGGQHPRYGTHNRLLGLADGLYLEVIAIDPGVVPQAGHSWFGLDQFTGPPRLANWICATDDLTAVPAAGPPRRLSRGDLVWDITVPDDGSLPLDGGCPTLIKWGTDTVHPSSRLDPSGCTLVRLDVMHPDADTIRAMLPDLDPRVSVSHGALALRATVQTPSGTKVLS